MDDEQLERDIEENEPENVRMAKRCLPAMNSINQDLKFTTEAPEDFPNNRLPTLDFVLWLVDGILFHSYYEKTIKNQFTVMQRSAMSEHQRMAILSNELVRRLSNINRGVVEEEIVRVIEQYASQLKTSGYGRKQARRWERRGWMKRRRRPGGLYTLAKRTGVFLNEA